jgi:hypothetical protein
MLRRALLTPRHVGPPGGPPWTARRCRAPSGRSCGRGRGVRACRARTQVSALVNPLAAAGGVLLRNFRHGAAYFADAAPCRAYGRAPEDRPEVPGSQRAVLRPWAQRTGLSSPYTTFSIGEPAGRGGRGTSLKKGAEQASLTRNQLKTGHSPVISGKVNPPWTSQRKTWKGKQKVISAGRQGPLARQLNQTGRHFSSCSLFLSTIAHSCFGCTRTRQNIPDFFNG